MRFTKLRLYRKYIYIHKYHTRVCTHTANMLELFGKEIVNIRNRINMQSKHEKEDDNNSSSKRTVNDGRQRENIRRKVLLSICSERTSFEIKIELESRLTD